MSVEYACGCIEHDDDSVTCCSAHPNGPLSDDVPETRPVMDEQHLEEIAGQVARRVACQMYDYESRKATVVAAIREALSSQEEELRSLREERDVRIDFKWYDAAVTALEQRNGELIAAKARSESAEAERDTFRAAWEASSDVAKKAVGDMGAERIKRKEAEAELQRLRSKIAEITGVL